MKKLTKFFQVKLISGTDYLTFSTVNYTSHMYVCTSRDEKYDSLPNSFNKLTMFGLNNHIFVVINLLILYLE